MTVAVTPFDPARDHWLGPRDAPVTLVEYGDYTSPESRRVKDIVARTVHQARDRVRFVYRHLPAVDRFPESDRAARAAIAAGRQGKFWDMHERLHRRWQRFGERDLRAVALEIGLDLPRFEADMEAPETRHRLEEDRLSARAAGVTTMPALFIDGEPYEDAWDELTLLEAVERPLGVRLRSASHAFVGWAAASGLMLLLATLAALAVANVGLHDGYERLFTTRVGVSFGDRGLTLPLRAWINDGLMTIFFLLVGIEIKREIVAGELSDMRRAALPLLGAIGGMVTPVAIYGLVNLGADTMGGWGVPMATDIAFTLGLLALLGRGVPAALRVFVAALAIADDIGAIVVLGLFYGQTVHVAPLLGAIATGAVLFSLNRARVYANTPYLVGLAVLWAFMHTSGLHASLAGVATALLIPSRPSGDLFGVAAQARAVFDAETSRVRRTRPGDRTISAGALRVLEHAMSRLRDPGYHVQHALEDWTYLLILPLFAFANTGIQIVGNDLALGSPMAWGVILGLTVGKPLGILVFCWLGVRWKIATLSAEISWAHLAGAGSLAGVGFTMSILIASAAFLGPELEAAKVSILMGSFVSAAAGIAILRATMPRT